MPIDLVPVETGGGAGDWGGGGGGAGRPPADVIIPEVGTVQILLSEGQVEGLVNGLQSVYLDGTPILASDGTTFNFTGVALALVAGTNTQPAISGITGTESEQGVNVQVKHGAPVTRSVTSNPSAVRVRISIPALKTINSGTGVATANSVTYTIERQNANYTPATLTLGAWEVVTLSDGGVVNEGPYSSKLTKSYRIETPTPGAWQIRVTRVSADDADVYHLSTTWWDAYTEIVDGAFRYPGSAVLSILVNSTQFQSIPQVNLHLRGAKIQVPANYTPASYDWSTKVWTAAVYATTGPGTTGGAWDGTFKTVWSNSPPWTFYAAATNTQWGAGSFLNASQLDKWSLYTISQWCDEMVSGEPRMTCNLYLQGQQGAIKALGQLASIFWGVIYAASGLIIPVADSDEAPSALFTNANVEGGRFTYVGTARAARHTACIASFVNPDLGYQQDTAAYEDEAGIARYGYNVLDYSGIGCTSYRQALDLAKWAIKTELMSPEVVSFTSGLEGSTTSPGKVIQVADQHRAGNTRAGGRILSATTTVIGLDAPVTLVAGTYTLRCQTATGMESRTVSTGAGTVSSLTVGSAFSSAPAVGSGWLLQAGTVASLWRVLSVKKAEGLKFEVTALKHDPLKYV